MTSPALDHKTSTLDPSLHNPHSLETPPSFIQNSHISNHSRPQSFEGSDLTMQPQGGRGRGQRPQQDRENQQGQGRTGGQWGQPIPQGQDRPSINERRPVLRSLVPAAQRTQPVQRAFWNQGKSSDQTSQATFSGSRRLVTSTYSSGQGSRPNGAMDSQTAQFSSDCDDGSRSSSNSSQEDRSRYGRGSTPPRPQRTPPRPFNNSGRGGRGGQHSPAPTRSFSSPPVNTSGMRPSPTRSIRSTGQHWVNQQELKIKISGLPAGSWTTKGVYDALSRYGDIHRIEVIPSKPNNGAWVLFQ